MNKQQIAYKALNFRIWREGISVNWDCTAKELANEVGCEQTTVFRHAKRSGWKIGLGRRASGRVAFDHAPRVDAIMNMEKTIWRTSWK